MTRSYLPLLVLILLSGRSSAELVERQVAPDLPQYHAEDARASVVTEQNLPASERFWPYHTSLERQWLPVAGGQPITAGTRGVLIRIEASGQARIDFGREGLHAVPIGETDLVELANRVRLGELQKTAPNFAFAIGPRLVDSAASSLRALDFRSVLERPGFLCVFADPSAEGFSELVSALGPLRDRHGVLTVFFPQGEYPDVALREWLRALGWTVPFLFDHLAEPYTPTLVDEGTAFPALMLVTNEGRVVFQTAWRGDVAPKLTSALDGAFGDARAAATPVAEPTTRP